MQVVAFAPPWRLCTKLNACSTWPAFSLFLKPSRHGPCRLFFPRLSEKEWFHSCLVFCPQLLKTECFNLMSAFLFSAFQNLNSKSSCLVFCPVLSKNSNTACFAATTAFLFSASKSHTGTDHVCFSGLFSQKSPKIGLMSGFLFSAFQKFTSPLTMFVSLASSPKNHCR